MCIGPTPWGKCHAKFAERRNCWFSQAGYLGAATARRIGFLLVFNMPGLSRR